MRNTAENNRSPHVFNIQVRSNVNANEPGATNLEILKEGMPDHSRPKRARKVKKVVPAPQSAPEQPQRKSEGKQSGSSPLKLINHAEQLAKNLAQQQIHTNFVHKVLCKDEVYTSAKTIPASVLSEHKN